MTNLEIAELLRAISAAYKIKNPPNSRFKIIAYDRAATAVEHLSSEAKDLWDEGKLEEVGGIGKSIEQYLGEIFTTGKCKHFEDLLSGLPPAIFELMKVSGIGPKTAMKLAQELNISSKDPLKQLEKAIKDGKVKKLEGMGESSEEAILKSLKETEGRDIRMLLPYANEIAQELTDYLLTSSNIVKASALGSLRRKVSTIGDIDMAVAAKDPKLAIKHFCDYPKASRVLEQGDRSASIILPGNRQVDVIVEKPEGFGALLQHFTGSKQHNISLRELALKKGLSVSDYGIYTKKGEKNSLKKFATEEDFYKFLGLSYIPPELREDTGEIKLAAEGKIPQLIIEGDIKADLQIHSSFDIETSHDLGVSTMEEVVAKASELNYEYIAFTEHNPSQSGHNSQEIVSILQKKKAKIEQINNSFMKGVKKSVQKVFNSLEIDILPDGNLPVLTEGLNTLDFALVSIHSSFNQDKEKQTARVLSALSHPKVKIFAHPTARKLNEREGVELDWPAIFEFCSKNNKWIEVNCDPARLDLPDFLVKEALLAGVKITLGTDAHATGGLDNMRFGVWNARRGWATKSDVVNTRSLEEFEKLLL